MFFQVPFEILQLINGDVLRVSHEFKHFLKFRFRPLNTNINLLVLPTVLYVFPTGRVGASWNVVIQVFFFIGKGLEQF